MSGNIRTFEDLHTALMKYSGKVVVYRGVRDAYKHLLIPKLGRIKFKTKSGIKTQEKTIFRLFRERSRPYLEFVPNDDWEWLHLSNIMVHPHVC